MEAATKDMSAGVTEDMHQLQVAASRWEERGARPKCGILGVRSPYPREGRTIPHDPPPL